MTPSLSIGSDPHPSGRWSWPLQPETYDQNPALTVTERVELGYWVNHTGKGYGVISEATAATLQRLVQPLEDTIAVIDFPTIYDGRVGLQLMLREMQQRQTSFWAWSPADWSTIIGPNHADFQRRVGKEHGRQHLLAIAYVLLDFRDFWELRFERCSLARKVFGSERVEAEIQRILTALSDQGYEAYGNEIHQYRAVVCEAMLSNRSPYLQDLTAEALDTARKRLSSKKHQNRFVALSVALERLGILQQPIHRLTLDERVPGSKGAMEGVAPEWSELCLQWFNTSALSFETRSGYFYSLLVAGRWLGQQHPDINHPNQWTRPLAAEYVGAVSRMRVGDYSAPSSAERVGKPLSAWSKQGCLVAMRTFFSDCQAWEWMDTGLNPKLVFKTPKSITAQLQPRPNQIDDVIWAKLLTAGLQLEADDLESPHTSGQRTHWYPTEMIRALAIVWLFCALRKDDIRRLRLGCIRWSTMTMLDSTSIEFAANGEAPTLDLDGSVCLLDLAPGKNGHAHTKAVDAIVGKAINAWEQVRPQQAPLIDQRTGEQVHYLFTYRGQRLGDPYLNKTLIPFLCAKAGVPEADIRGKITSHRARHTMLTQLSETMTIPQLQSWSGHKSSDALMHYLQLTVKKQAEAYQKSDYFKRNLRTFEVLIDTAAVTNGTAAAGEPWQYYKLDTDAYGHGYCTYDFFEQCPHKVACPQCEFYRSPQVIEQRFRENQAGLMRLLREIELTTEERSAIEGGVQALEQLAAQLATVSTPEGLTPQELQTLSLKQAAREGKGGCL